MRTELNARNSQGNSDTTRTARSFIIDAPVLFWFPPPMVLTSSFDWANLLEAGHMIPRFHFARKNPTHPAIVSRDHGSCTQSTIIFNR